MTGNNPPEILVIKSDISQLKSVELFINKLFNKFNIPDCYFNKVYLCVSEAVINSIIHGNKKNKDKRVFIKVHHSGDKLKVKVEDEGDGFSLENVEDPTVRKNIQKETGRGIHIIKALTEYIKYNKKGNSIHFKINCK